MHSYQKRIGENLLNFLRLKGYTKTSLSRLTEISRPTLNQIIEGRSPNPKIYEDQIKKITESLDLPNDYFLQNFQGNIEKWQLPTTQYSDRSSLSPERSEYAQMLIDDLDELLTVAALYIRE